MKRELLIITLLLLFFSYPCFSQDWPKTGVYAQKYSDKYSQASGLQTQYFDCRQPERTKMSCLLTTTTLLKYPLKNSKEEGKDNCHLFSTSELSDFFLTIDKETENTSWVSSVKINTPCEIIFEKRFEKKERWIFSEKAIVKNPESKYSQGRYYCKDFVSADSEYMEQRIPNFEISCSTITVNKE